MSFRPVLTVIVVTALFGCATRHIDPTAREVQDAWVAATVQKLQSFRPSPETRRVELGYSDAYGIPGNEGSALIEFGANGWVYVLTHSSHNDERIGDISIAIDNTGALWENLGHVCGGIRFGGRDGGGAKSPEEFFRHCPELLGSKWKRL